MCGIVGVVQYDSKVSREIRQKALKILFADNMLRTQARGRDATGVYQVMANGDWMMAKKAEKVSEWLFKERSEHSDPQIYQDFADTWASYPHELRALVGHCRSRTVGSTANVNNHPFAIQVDEKNAILGVHNGTLDNHETIFKRLPNLLERQGDVDSEAIFHYLFYTTANGTREMSPEVIKSLGERIEGSYAVVVSNSLFPHQVTAFRQTRPLHMCMISPLNMVLLTSDSKFIKDSLEQYKFIRQSVIPELPILKVDERMLSERDFRIFDTRKKFPETLNYQSMNEISEGGEFKGISAKILPEWKDEPMETSSPNSADKGKDGTSDHSPKVSKGSASTPYQNRRTTFPSKVTAKQDARDEESTIVDVEILDKDGKPLDMSAGEAKETEEAWKNAESIGLTVNYENDRELAQHIGVDVVDLVNMGHLKLASELSKVHFALYYALGRVDTADEIKGVRRSARGQHRRIERAEEKKKLAEGKIWEFRALTQIFIVLHKRRYKLCTGNVKLILDSYPGISASRREDILRTAKSVLESADTEKIIEALAPKFDKAELSKALQLRELEPTVKLLPEKIAE